MNSHEEYVTYAQAKALKELGFDWPCRTSYYTSKAFPSDKGRFVRSLQFYNNSEMPGHWCSAPTQAAACRWLREEKGIYIHPLVNKYNINQWRPFLVRYNKRTEESWVSDFPTYEAALSAGIDRALELLKQS